MPSSFIHRYNIFFTIVTYLIPMLQMLVSYSHMSYILWRTNLFIPPAAKTEPTNGSITSRRDSYMAQQSERAIVNKRKVKLGCVSIHATIHDSLETHDLS